MKKTNKKGFTLVELLVVIAIVAILATVAIIGYTSFINKANTSADQQAVTQMNTLLSGEEVSNKPTTLIEAIAALRESDVDMEDYKPLAKDMYFFWVRELNRVVYTDKDYNIVFPENLVGTTYKMEDGWYSLSGVVEEDDGWKDAISSGVVTVDDGAELVSLMNAFFRKESSINGITKIELTKDIDLRGAAANFGQVLQNVEIVGNKADGTNVVIYGLRSEVASVRDDTNDTNTMSDYGFGFFGMIGNGSVSINVTIKNITFKNASINAPKNDTGHIAVVAGRVTNGSTLTVENVTIENCFVRGEKKVAALVGYLQNTGKLYINGNLTVTNTTVMGGREVAGVIAYVQRSSGLVVDANAVITTDVTVIADESYGWTYSDTLTLNGNTRTFADESKGYATKEGEGQKLGVTNKDYWDTSDNLTIEQHFGVNGSTVNTEADNAKNFN